MGIIDIDDRGRNDPKGHHSRAMGLGAGDWDWGLGIGDWGLGIGGWGLGFRHSLRTTAAGEAIDAFFCRDDENFALRAVNGADGNARKAT